ncbi:unnamed protein product [Parnassius apollo]|uniref:(apollo) hypothetical protein n=1 Tax=Parnassius apollo TaxID=110799 RepID=A0A8S3X6J6_PARAO|nr:unnamed protein product [Parnassius apollo]
MAGGWPSILSDEIVRPCALMDLACIRRNLAINSACNPNVVGSVPAQYTVQLLRSYAPYFNSTYEDNNLIIRNHNRCRVSAFIFNLSRQSAVLTLDCPQLEFESNRTVIQHASYQEDKYYSYRYKGTYPLVRLTTYLRYNNGLNLCTTFTFADVAALPTFVITPNDLKTERYLSRDLGELNIFERETFFWRSALLARYFINLVLCNFGCNY